jgi:hypothetical protein
MVKRKLKSHPWYKRSLELGVVFVGIAAVQILTAQHVDKDEYQRIVGTSLVFLLREYFGNREG